MTKTLFGKTLLRFGAGVVALMALTFLPAGTWAYPGAWRLMGVLFVPMALLGAWLMVKNPALLEKRLRAKESREEQSTVVKLSGLMFLAGLTVAGLDFRFGWSRLPEWVSWTACGIFLVGYGLYAEVMRENAFLSRTVEIQEGQRVVDTGLYGIVRHPMYTAVILLFTAMPLMLGSVPGFLIFLVCPAIMVKRIRNEEALLEAELEGYREYQQKVRWRLLPFVW